MRSYRDRYEIIADILEIAKRNPKKTQIMYQANLSYKVCKKYLSEIENASLIFYLGEERCYTLTEKGKEFLELYDKYSKDNMFLQKKLKDVHVKQEMLEKLCNYRNHNSLFDITG